ncbi:MAG: hypothetical protein AABX27_02775 [Nanoarchaeota archaeon]
MAKLIKVPAGIVAARFPDIEKSTSVGYDLGKLFHQMRDGWYVAYGQRFDSKAKVYNAHLLPSTGQLITGLGKIAEDYDNERSVRNRLMERWGRGNQLGALYVLTEQDIEDRLGDNEINDEIKVGDKAVCMEHSGDCFFDYQLLQKIAGNLAAPKGRTFGAYSLLGTPRRILKMEYMLSKL